MTSQKPFQNTPKEESKLPGIVILGVVLLVSLIICAVGLYTKRDLIFGGYDQKTEHNMKVTPQATQSPENYEEDAAAREAVMREQMERQLGVLTTQPAGSDDSDTSPVIVTPPSTQPVISHPQQPEEFDPTMLK